MREYFEYELEADDDLMSIDQWNDVKDDYFDQGTGYWCKIEGDNLFRSNDDVDITEKLDSTHVLWFNK